MATDQQVLAAHRDLVDALAERARRRAEADRLIEALRGAERLHDEANSRVLAASNRMTEFAKHDAKVPVAPVMQVFTESKVETKPAPVPVDDNKAKPPTPQPVRGGQAKARM